MKDKSKGGIHKKQMRHDDVKQDKQLVKKMVTKDCRK